MNRETDELSRMVGDDYQSVSMRINYRNATYDGGHCGSRKS
jgi:hypothetical protein